MMATPRKGRSKGHVLAAAINQTTSKYGEIITEKNPQMDKELSKKLQKINVDQKKREQNHFWQQRRFFLDQAFDDQQELRFVKLKNKVQQDLSDVNTQLVNKYTSSVSASSPVFLSESYPHRTDTESRDRKEETFTQKIFPVSEAFENVSKGINYLRLQQKREELYSLWRSRKATLVRNVTAENRKSGQLHPPDVDRRTCNPILLPIRNESPKSKNKKLNKTKKDPCPSKKELSQINVQTDKITCAHDGQNSEPRGRIPSNETEVTVTDLEAIESTMLANENYYNTTSEPKPSTNCQSKSKVGNDNRLMNIINQSFESITKKTANEARGNQIIDDTSIFQKRLQNLQQSFTPRDEGTLSSDELLIKLTKSLPIHMLIKTDETLNDLSTALGYSERNKMLLEREKTLASQLGVGDERYRKLQAVLVSVKFSYVRRHLLAMV